MKETQSIDDLASEHRRAGYALLNWLISDEATNSKECDRRALAWGQAIVDDLNTLDLSGELSDEFVHHPHMPAPNIYADPKKGFAKIRYEGVAHRMRVLEAIRSRINGEPAPEVKPEKTGAIGPVSKPNGWTKSEIVAQVKDACDGSFSPSKFDTIRKRAGVKKSDRGGKGQQRRFGRDELKDLKEEVEGGTYRKKDSIVASLQELLDQ